MKFALPPDLFLSPSSWIWGSDDRRGYNLFRYFRTSFQGRSQATTLIGLSADCRYRCWINGKRVGDGPVRGWPEHYYYDVRDVSPLIHDGENEIVVLVRFYGCGVFQLAPVAAAFRGCIVADGKCLAGTDEKWETRTAAEYPSRMPKVSIQNSAMEQLDLTQPETPWEAARVVDENVPTGLSPADVRLAEEKLTALPPPAAIRALAPQTPTWAVPLVQLCHPQETAIHMRRDKACALLTMAEVTTEGLRPWYAAEWDVWINGRIVADSGAWNPAPGTYCVALFPKRLFPDSEAPLQWPTGNGIRWSHPLGSEGDNPWTFLRLEDFRTVGNDLVWLWFPARDLEELNTVYEQEKARLGAATASTPTFAKLAARARTLPFADNFFVDADASFCRRDVLKQIGEAPLPEIYALTDHQEAYYDLDEQRCGYLELEIESTGNFVLDVNITEYMTKEGVIQHTTSNRNGMRIRGGAGMHRIASLQRRSGRHVFLTARETAGEIKVLKASIRESLYPARLAAPFRCSDPVLGRIWDAADRTMRLSMDDVFIDSLYEQTLWVGDARNEQLYALWAYGAADISQRSQLLAGQSLERLPMVQSQVPSCWENILPVWSFLWNIAVQEYYHYTADREMLRRFWPWARKNLRGAACQINQDGLFDVPWWNLFEWAHLDCHHTAVLYNTMFFRGAVEAALEGAILLDERDDIAWLRTLSRRLREAVLREWNEKLGLFPEAVRSDGTTTTRFGVQAQFLAVLYGIVEGETAVGLMEKVLGGHPGLEGIGSPFALQYLYEACEAAGLPDRIVPHLRDSFQPMVEIGTTLWEALPGSRTTPPGFPTRSHCHGWSACPLYFLPRIVLGLRSLEPGARRIAFSPIPGDLAWAEGALATPQGPVRVEWHRKGSVIAATVHAPAGCEVVPLSNPMLEREGLTLKITSS